jgi:carboxymethylenebutenolidase
MERKKASDFPPEVLKLFDGYVHGTMSRRDFLDGAAKFAVGGFTAAAMLEALKPNFAWAQQVAKDDARIRVDYLDYPSPQGSGRMRGYYARPAKIAGKLPAVLVIHENRGLNPYIEDVARRLALLDFLAFAPDALTPVGGYPGDEDTARKLFAGLDPKKRIEDLAAAADFIKTRPEYGGRYGVVGFCFGGTISNLFATRMPDLAAAVPFYGSAAPLEDVPKIRAPLLIHLASDDERINVQYPPYEAALKAHGKRYEIHMYPNTQHGFHNDTTPRYDEAAAKLAWQRTVDFFNLHLRGG